MTGINVPLTASQIQHVPARGHAKELKDVSIPRSVYGGRASMTTGKSSRYESVSVSASSLLLP